MQISGVLARSLSFLPPLLLPRPAVQPLWQPLLPPSREAPALWAPCLSAAVCKVTLNRALEHMGSSPLVFCFSSGLEPGLLTVQYLKTAALCILSSLVIVYREEISHNQRSRPIDA